MTRANGDDLDLADPVAPVNNWLHALFSQVDLYLKGTLVTSSINMYAYRAYIETLLSYGPDAKYTQLTSQLWHKDTATRMDVVEIADGPAANEGFVARRENIVRSRLVDMMCRLHTVGRTCKITCSSVPCRNVWCCSASITMPTTACTPRIRFTPRTTTSTSTRCTWTDDRYPPNQTQPDFEDDLFVRSYMSMFSSTGKMWQDEGNGLTRSDYRHGYTFFGFDLTPDQCDGPCFHLEQKVNLRIEFAFPQRAAEHRERRRLRRARVRAGNRQEPQRHLRLLRWTPCISLDYWRWTRAPDRYFAASYPKTTIDGALPANFVCNTYDGDEPGEHWIALYLDAD